MDKILKNKKFLDIREIEFTPELKKRLGGVLGMKCAREAEKVSKSVKGFQFTYKSKNGKISGLLALPKILKTKKIPCIIYNRGGYKDFGSLKLGALYINMGRLAAEGYAVIASQYSGNSLSDGKDEYGGNDVEDIISLYDLLKTVSFVDINKIGMYGGSRGGMMTFLAMRKVKWIKTVCIKSGLYDLVSSEKNRPEFKRVFKEAFGGSKEEMIKRSVTFWADKLPKNVPILMLHGTSDWRADPLGVLETSKKFVKFKIPHRLILFEGADHFLSEVSDESNLMTISWFDKYLKNDNKLPDLNPHGE